MFIGAAFGEVDEDDQDTKKQKRDGGDAAPDEPKSAAEGKSECGTGQKESYSVNHVALNDNQKAQKEFAQLARIGAERANSVLAE